MAVHSSPNLHIIAVIQFLSVVVTTTPLDSFIPTFFGRLHENGTEINRALPQYNEEIESKPWINKISREDAASITLKVWPDTVKNGGKATVLWEGVVKPQAKDMITYYCPYYDDPKHYLDFFYAKSAEEWQSGYGHYEITLYNMRESCIFKYYRLKSKHYVLAATSNKVNFDDGGPYAPLQGHIALTNNPTEMRVMWVSGEVRQPPVVRYGTTKNFTMKEHSYIMHTYTKDSLCQNPAKYKQFWHPGITYDVLLKNLKPNTMYYYSYGTEKYMSTIANFTTALPKGDTTPFKFVIYGDMGAYPNSFPRPFTTAKNVRKDVDKNEIRFVSHIGDISYAEGYAYMWETWGWLIEPYATLVPYMVCIGNHEYDHTGGGLGRDPSKVDTADGWRPSWFPGSIDSGGECGVPMHNRYHMPDNGNSVFWYSYDYGMVHMITISTEHDFTPGSVQHTWLENDLKSVDHKVTPWLLLGGHRPMYSSENYKDDHIVGTYMQTYFEDLLYKYKVDLAFWGHQHTYERTCKLYKYKCVDDGILHVVVGNAGRALDANAYTKRDWSMAHVKEYGYGRVTVANSSALLFEMVGNQHDEVRDHVWVYKNKKAY